MPPQGTSKRCILTDKLATGTGVLRIKEGSIIVLHSLRKLSAVVSLLAAVLLAAASAQTPPADAAAKLLPDAVGDFRAQGLARPSGFGIFEQVSPDDFEVVAQARRSYAAPGGETFSVSLVQTRSDSAAYALLTHVARAGHLPSSAIRVGGIGTAHVPASGASSQVSFVKGATFVDVLATGDAQASAAPALNQFATLLAGTLNQGSGTIPVLVSHLPDAERALERHTYAVSLNSLQTAVGNKPALDALSFEGGTEAVTADYGEACLVVVEFTTPQYAADNDARISERIRQLREAGQTVPSFYKREGNYAVFVFDAADERAAEELAANVKYEKEVRWLGPNPHAQARAEQQYTNTMGNVILTTLKTTGLAILLCLSVGGLFGGAIFLRRRARTAAQEVYTDAGGMLRLNLEDVNAGGDAATASTRLVSKREV